MFTNWKTLTSGLVAAITGVLSYIASAPPELQNQIPQMFPEQYRGTIGMTLKIIAGIATLVMAASAKDKGVTGNGTVTRPYTVADGTGGNKIVNPMLVALLIPALFLGGCAYDGSFSVSYEDAAGHKIGTGFTVHPRDGKQVLPLLSK